LDTGDWVLRLGDWLGVLAAGVTVMLARIILWLVVGTHTTGRLDESAGELCAAFLTNSSARSAAVIAISPEAVAVI
jgi:hypothetical protein